MDPIGLVLGIVGVYSTCLEGYKLVTSCVTAEEDLQSALQRMYILQGRLSAWGESWDLKPHHPSTSTSTSRYNNSARAQSNKATPRTLQKFLEEEASEHVAASIVLCLSKISDLLADGHHLRSWYGLKLVVKPDARDSRELHDREVNDIIEGRLPPLPRPLARKDPHHLSPEMSRRLEKKRKGISYLQRCHWALKDGKKFERLLKSLRQYNKDLESLTHNRKREDQNLAVILQMLEGMNRKSDLRHVQDAAEAETRIADRAGEPQGAVKGSRMLAEIAGFKSRVQESGIRGGKRAVLLDSGLYKLHSPQTAWAENGATLGYSYKLRKVVLIEWRSYLQHPRVKDNSAINEIHNLADLLCTEGRPAEFRVPPCLGFFDDNLEFRYGFVYELPPHLANFDRLYPGDLSRRCPVTLKALLDRSSADVTTPIVDLGIRFRLASQLASSLYTIHVCGFLHKNIRPSSVLFFPDKSDLDPREPSTTGRKELDKPYLMGWGFTRVQVPEETKGGYDSVGIGRALSRRAEITLDSYHHPKKRLRPTDRYRRAYDIYSLGLVLLEIGLWDNFGPPIGEAADPEDMENFRKDLLRDVVPDLRGQCGSIYEEVVKTCLNVGYDENETEEDMARVLCWDIAKRLRDCCA